MPFLRADDQPDCELRLGPTPGLKEDAYAASLEICAFSAQSAPLQSACPFERHAPMRQLRAQMPDAVVACTDGQESYMADQPHQGAWRTSTESNTDNCVEVAFTDGTAMVRHSKAPEQVMHFSRSEWEAFLGGVRKHEFDWPTDIH